MVRKETLSQYWLIFLSSQIDLHSNVYSICGAFYSLRDSTSSSDDNIVGCALNAMNVKCTGFGDEMSATCTCSTVWSDAVSGCCKTGTTGAVNAGWGQCNCGSADKEEEDALSEAWRWHTRLEFLSLVFDNSFSRQDIIKKSETLRITLTKHCLHKIFTILISISNLPYSS